MGAQFSGILDEVVSEGIVVVEDEDHRVIVIGGGGTGEGASFVIHLFFIRGRCGGGRVLVGQ